MYVTYVFKFFAVQTAEILLLCSCGSPNCIFLLHGKLTL